jgi:hypothetical protein
MVKTFSKIIISFSLFIFLPHFVFAATLSISPSERTLIVGEQITVKVIISSANVPFNAVSGSIIIPSSIFEIQSVSKTNSVLDFWVTEPTFSKDSNIIVFEGVSLGGYQDPIGTVITITLNVTKAGSGRIYFKSGQVLANDGQGTDITKNLIGTMFSAKESSYKKLPIKKDESTIIQPELITQPAPTLKAPEIILGTKYGEQAVSGISDYPNSQTLITFLAQDGTKIFILGFSGDDGSFNVIVPKSLKSGIYSISAVMIKQDKTNSDKSNVITLQMGNIFSDVGWQIWLVIVLLIFSVLYLLIRLHSHFGKNENNKDKLNKAEFMIHESFNILKKDVEGYNNEKSTNLEREHLSFIEKDINSIEEKIDEEIKEDLK